MTRGAEDPSPERSVGVDHSRAVHVRSLRASRQVQALFRSQGLSERAVLQSVFAFLWAVNAGRRDVSFVTSSEPFLAMTIESLSVDPAWSLADASGGWARRALAADETGPNSIQVRA